MAGIKESLDGDGGLDAPFGSCCAVEKDERLVLDGKETNGEVLNDLRVAVEADKGLLYEYRDDRDATDIGRNSDLIQDWDGKEGDLYASEPSPCIPRLVLNGLCNLGVLSWTLFA